MPITIGYAIMDNHNEYSVRDVAVDATNITTPPAASRKRTIIPSRPERVYKLPSGEFGAVAEQLTRLQQPIGTHVMVNMSTRYMERWDLLDNDQRKNMMNIVALMFFCDKRRWEFTDMLVEAKKIYTEMGGSGQASRFRTLEEDLVAVTAVTQGDKA